MEDTSHMPPEGSEFPEFLNGDRIYVDKTDFLASMIAGASKNWFLSRPRLFGKTLLVSTLETILTDKLKRLSEINTDSLSYKEKEPVLLVEKRKLFKGIAIKKRTGKKLFAPRPVIRLDMAGLSGNIKEAELDKGLRKLVAKVAKEEHGIKLSKRSSPGAMLAKLIAECYQKDGVKVAVLIDDCDAPVRGLIDDETKTNKALLTLQKFYGQIEASEEYISFAFATGILNFCQGGRYSVFKKFTDISVMPKFGAIAGYTRKEVELNFKEQIRETSEVLRIKEDELVRKINEYYEGFCFDGKTLLHNPYSILMFFKVKKFANFWLDAVMPKRLTAFIKDTHLTIEDFRNSPISPETAENPKEDIFTGPEGRLYELGFLSLRKSYGEEEEGFKLDYPNLGIRKSLALTMLKSFYGTPLEAQKASERTRVALTNRNPRDLAVEINKYLSVFPYADYGIDPQEETDYLRLIASFLHATGANIYMESPESLGRADFILIYKAQTWIIYTKILHPEEAAGVISKKEGDKIMERNYGVDFFNPVLFFLNINHEKRLITSWSRRDGFYEGPSEEGVL
jgi:hypothetical protein